MTVLFSLLPLLLAVALYACFVKLAAKLYKRSSVAWKHAFALSAMGFAIGLLATGLLRISAGPIGPVGLLVGLVLQSALGGWFLGTRAHSATGAPVQFRGGAIIAALAAFTLGGVAFLIKTVLPAVVGLQ